MIVTHTMTHTCSSESCRRSSLTRRLFSQKPQLPGEKREEVYPGKNPENQFSVELFEAWAWKRTWATSGGRGVCFSGAPMQVWSASCLCEDRQVRLSMD